MATQKGPKWMLRLFDTIMGSLHSKFEQPMTILPPLQNHCFGATENIFDISYLTPKIPSVFLPISTVF
jgi:hypothetical protein